MAKRRIVWARFLLLNPLPFFFFPTLLALSRYVAAFVVAVAAIAVAVTVLAVVVVA
jgi:hypothetical protein